MTDATLPLGTSELELHALTLDYAHLRARDVRAEALLAASIEQDGQLHPALVVRRDEGGHVLIDGYRRVRALKKLGRDTVVVIVLGTCEPDALAYCHRLATGGRRSAVEDGWLVRELTDGQGRSLSDVASSLGRSTSWVSRRLALAQTLPPSVEKAVQRGALPPHGAMRSLVPLARANKAHAEMLVCALASARPTTRQLATLWAAYRVADDEHRARIVEAPLLCLKAVEATTPPLTIRAVTRDAEAATKALGRAYTSLLAARAHDPRVGAAPSVKRAIARAADACAALVAAEMQ